MLSPKFSDVYCCPSAANASVVYRRARRGILSETEQGYDPRTKHYFASVKLISMAWNTVYFRTEQDAVYFLTEIEKAQMEVTDHESQLNPRT